MFILSRIVLAMFLLSRIVLAMFVLALAMGITGFPE